MIQMKFKDLLHPRLQQILGKVANTPMDPKQSYEVNKLLGVIRETVRKNREENTQKLRTFLKFDGDKPAFKRDEKGEVVVNEETGQPEFEFLAPYSYDHPDYIASYKEFEVSEASLDFRPWSLDMLSQNGVKLSPAEIDVLGGLITTKPYLQAVEEKYN